MNKRRGPDEYDDDAELFLSQDLDPEALIDSMEMDTLERQVTQPFLTARRRVDQLTEARRLRDQIQDLEDWEDWENWEAK